MRRQVVEYCALLLFSNSIKAIRYHCATQLTYIWLLPLEWNVYVNIIRYTRAQCRVLWCIVLFFFFFFFFRNRNRLITNTFKQFAYMYKYVVHPCFVVSRTREFVVVASLTRVSRSIRPNWRLCSPPPGDSEREQFGAITRVDRTTVSVISSSEIRLDRRTAGEICIWRKYTCLCTERPLRKKG